MADKRCDVKSVRAFFKKFAVPFAVLAWASLLAGGFTVLMRYESVAASPPHVSSEINSLFRNAEQPTLVVGLHPHCPCSKATVAELNKILGHTPGKSRLVVYAFKPKAETVDWIASSTISTLNKLGARIEIDEDGLMAKQLGLSASGQIQLFSAQGELIYNGGITAGRGHEGDNAGEQAVIDLLLKGGSDRKSAPVFGCPIFETKSP
jgi:hypothetical protein